MSNWNFLCSRPPGASGTNWPGVVCVVDGVVYYLHETSASDTPPLPSWTMAGITGDAYMLAMNGDYYLAEDQTYNAKPVYLKMGPGLWNVLFYSDDGYWVLGMDSTGQAENCEDNYYFHSDGADPDLPDAPWVLGGTGTYHTPGGTPVLSASTPGATYYYPFYKREDGVWTALTGPSRFGAQLNYYLDINGITINEARWWRRVEAYGLGDGRIAFAGWLFYAKYELYDTGHYPEPIYDYHVTLTVTRLVRVYDIEADEWTDYLDDTSSNVTEMLVSYTWGETTYYYHADPVWAIWTNIGRSLDGVLHMAADPNWVGTGASQVRTWDPDTGLFAAESSDLQLGNPMAHYFKDPGQFVFADHGFYGFIGLAELFSLFGSVPSCYVRSGDMFFLDGAYTGHGIGPSVGDTLWSYVVFDDFKLGSSFAHNGDSGAPVKLIGKRNSGGGYYVYRYTGKTPTDLGDFPSATSDSGLINLYQGDGWTLLVHKSGIYRHNADTGGGGTTPYIAITDPDGTTVATREFTIQVGFFNFTTGSATGTLVLVAEKPGEDPITLYNGPVAVTGGSDLIDTEVELAEPAPEGAYLLSATLTSTLGSGSDVTSFLLDLGGGGGGDDPPTVEIVTPADEMICTGTVEVSVLATDDVAVARVEIYIDGVLVATITETTNGFYVWSWDTTNWINGDHTLMAKAVDGGGQFATDTHTITTQNLMADQRRILFSPLVPCPVQKTTRAAEGYKWDSPDEDPFSTYSVTVWMYVTDDPGGYTTDLSKFTQVLNSGDLTHLTSKVGMYVQWALVADPTIWKSEVELTGSSNFVDLCETDTVGELIILSKNADKLWRYNSLTAEEICELPALSGDPDPVAVAWYDGVIYVAQGPWLRAVDPDTGEISVDLLLDPPADPAITAITGLTGTPDALLIGVSLTGGAGALYGFSWGSVTRLCETDAAPGLLKRLSSTYVAIGSVVYSFSGGTLTELFDTAQTSVLTFDQVGSMLFVGTGNAGIGIENTVPPSTALDLTDASLLGFASSWGYLYSAGNSPVLWRRNEALSWEAHADINLTAVERFTGYAGDNGATGLLAAGYLVDTARLVMFQMADSNNGIPSGPLPPNVIGHILRSQEE